MACMCMCMLTSAMIFSFKNITKGIDKDITINGALGIYMYKDDLTFPELIDADLARWKSKFQGKQVKIIPDSCAKAIKVCDKVIHPNISVLLQI